MRKTIFIMVGLVVVAIGTYYLTAYYRVTDAFRNDGLTNDLKYDKDTWQNGTRRQRGQMVKYLLDSIGIIDRSKTEISSILGDPDDEHYIGDEEYKVKFYYAVDEGDAFGYDMIIFFDTTDHAKYILFDD